MSKFSKDDLRHAAMLFAAASVAGVVASAPSAASGACSCLPAFNRTSINSNSFEFLGTQSAGWITNLTNDTLYGLDTDAAILGNVYFKMSGAGVWSNRAEVCRWAFTGLSVNCDTNIVSGTGNAFQAKIFDASDAASSTYALQDSFTLRFYTQSANTIQEFRSASMDIPVATCW